MLPLAALFWLLSTLRRQLFRLGVLQVQRIQVPVVVVGNIAVGGSGKTPVVQWLVEQLREAGYRPGVISRGYGGRVRGAALVDSAADPAEYGDEPVLIARACGCPVAVGADRPAAARHLLEAHPECDVLISDDGLQHYRLHRDCEIIVVDPATLGNGWLIPAGPLREAPGRLAQADLVIAHGNPDPAVFARAGEVPVRRMRLVGGMVHVLGDVGRRKPLGELAGQRVHAIAGIGRPERFFDQLRAAGLEVVPHPFPDHHHFVAADLATGDDLPRILTAKDAVKCETFAPPETWVFPVRARIEAGAAGRILEKLKHGREIA